MEQRAGREDKPDDDKHRYPDITGLKAEISTG